MTITVVIPTLNEAQTLPGTLTHSLGLGFDHIVIVDGGSRDRTKELAETFRRSSAPPRPLPPLQTDLTILSTRPSRAHQMNLGACATQADVLLFLHSDTFLPQHARTAIEEALQDPRAIGGRFDVRFERDRGWSWVISRMMNLRSRISGIATGDQAIFVRRKEFDRLGGYADLPLMEDIDLTRRLKKAGTMVALSDQVQTSFRRWDHGGPLKTILLMWTLRLLYWTGVSPHRLSHWYRVVR